MARGARMTLGQATGGRPAPVAARPPVPRSLGLGLGLGANQRRNFQQAAAAGQGAQFAGTHPAIANRIQNRVGPNQLAQQGRIQQFIGSGGQVQGRAAARRAPMPGPPTQPLPMQPPPQGNPSMGMVGGTMNQPQNPYGVNPGMQSVIDSRMQQGQNAGGYGFDPSQYGQYNSGGQSYQTMPGFDQNAWQSAMGPPGGSGTQQTPNRFGGFGGGGWRPMGSPGMGGGNYLTAYGSGQMPGQNMANFGSIMGGWGGAGSGGGGFNPGNPLSAQPMGYGGNAPRYQSALQSQTGQNLYGQGGGGGGYWNQYLRPNATGGGMSIQGNPGQVDQYGRPRVGIDQGGYSGAWAGQTPM